MSTSMSASHADNTNTGDKPRIRKLHSKVKTGCITCKIRRKKCDEAKPACMRCIKAGRKCDGYTQDTPSAPASTAAVEVNPPILSPSQSSQQIAKFRSTPPSPKNGRRTNTWQPLSWPLTQTLFASELHTTCFDYFRIMTGPQLGSYLFNPVWSSFVVRAALLHPAVMKAVAAVGAAHRRYDLGISREAFEYCEISTRLFGEAKAALEHYKRNSWDQACAKEVILFTQLLYGVFEVFQGNFGMAARYIAQGLTATWHGPSSIVFTQSQRCQIQPDPESFHKLYRRLGIFAERVVGRQPRILTDYRIEPMPNIPISFASFGEGLDHMFTQADYLLHVRKSVWHDSRARRKMQTLHVSRILQWNAALAEISDSATANTLEGRKNHTLLRKARNVTYLLLYLVLFAMHDPGQRMSPSRAPPNETNAELIRNMKDSRDDHKHDKDFTQENDQASRDTFIVDSAELWHHINQNEDIKTNISRVTMIVGTMMDGLSEPEDQAYTVSLNVGTGIGPPRSSRPGTEGSSKTRHLILALLDDASRDEVYMQSDSIYNNHISTAASAPDLPNNDMTHEMQSIPSCSTTIRTASGPAKSPTKQGTHRKAYGIAEQLCSIEEHSVLAAAKSSLILPRGLTPRWLDVSYYLEERRMRVRYCHRDSDSSPGVIGPSGGGLVWTHEWIAF